MLNEQLKEIESLKKAAEMEFQKADGKAEMKRWFQEQLVTKDALLGEQAKVIEEFKNQIHASRTLWCDSKRDPESGFVDIKYLDQFEKTLESARKGGGEMKVEYYTRPDGIIFCKCCHQLPVNCRHYVSLDKQIERLRSQLDELVEALEKIKNPTPEWSQAPTPQSIAIEILAKIREGK